MSSNNLKKMHLNSLEESLLNIGVEDYDLIQFIINHNKFAEKGIYADEYLELIFNLVNRDATITMNCFTWNSFCQNSYFHIDKTPSEVGLASEIFRRMENVIRSPHPIYSMCAKGPMAEDIMIHEGSTCWGEGTPFEKLVNNDCFCITIGNYLDKGITLFHRFEEVKKVPYRYYKEFRGIVNFGSGFKQYSTRFFVRKDMNMKYSWKPALKKLDMKGSIMQDKASFSVYGVSAKELEKICYSLLDKDIKVFTKCVEDS